MKSSILSFALGLLTVTPALAQWGGCGGGGGSQPNSSMNADGMSEKENEDQAEEADPVLVASGAFIAEATDLVLPVPFPLHFTRNYDSRAAYDGPLGYNWDFSLNRRLKIATNGDVYVFTGNGIKRRFVKSGTSYITPDRRTETLVFSSGSYTLSEPDGDTYVFDSAGLLTECSNRNQNALFFEYDTNDRLYAVADENGNYLVTFQYISGSGRIDYIISPLKKIDYTYSTAGDLTEVHHYQYPSEILDKTVNYDYHSGHLLKSEKRWIPHLTNPTGIQQITMFQNTYDTQNRVRYQSRGTGTGEFIYDPANSKTTFFDYKGFKTEYYFDSLDRETKRRVFTSGLHAAEPTYYETSKFYNSAGWVRKIVLPNGSSVHYTYDTKGNVKTVTRRKTSSDTADATDLVTRFDYELQFSQVERIEDPEGNVTTFTFDYELSLGDAGNVVKMTLPTVAAGTPEYEYTYNSRGLLETVKNPEDVVTRHTYDIYGYPENVTVDYGGSLAATTQFEFDMAGRLTQIIDPKLNVTELTYNSVDKITYQGKLTSVTGEQSERVHREYLPQTGLLIRETRSIPTKQDQITRFRYNTLGLIDRVSRVADGGGEQHQYLYYDKNDNLSQTIDEGGKSTLSRFDERDLIYEREDAESRIVKYDYDSLGLLAKLRDEKSNPTQFLNDEFGRLWKKIFADSTYNEFTHDKNGNIKRKRNADGVWIDYDYNAHDQLKQIEYPQLIEYAYDIMGRLDGASENGTSIDYEYDRLGRVETFTDQRNLTSGFQYDAAGNRDRITWPGATFVTVGHDAVNRPKTVRLSGTGTPLVDLTYDGRSRATNIAFANGTTATRSFNRLGEIDAVQNQLSGQALDYSYQYHQQGIQWKRTGPEGVREAIYDDTYRLTQAIQPSGAGFPTTGYGYDAAGNREGVTTAAGTVGYVPNTLNQYDTIGSQALDYDDNGQLLEDHWDAAGGYSAGRSFTWDNLGRLESVRAGPSRIDYSYDPLGRRVGRKVYNYPSPALPVLTAEYAYHFDGNDILSEHDLMASTQPAIRGFHRLSPLTAPVWEFRKSGTLLTGTVNYFHDALGSVVGLSDSSTSFSRKLTYDAYGNATVKTGSGASYTPGYELQFGYTGHAYDHWVGIYLTRYRGYDPRSGRWLSRDPISEAGGLNLYGYCYGSPLNLRDFDGKIPLPLITGTIGAIAGGIIGGLTADEGKFLQGVGKGALSGGLAGLTGGAAGMAWGAVAGGAVSGAVGSAISQSLDCSKSLTTGRGLTKLALSTGMGAAFGGLGNWINSGVSRSMTGTSTPRFIEMTNEGINGLGIGLPAGIADGAVGGGVDGIANGLEQIERIINGEM